MRPSVSMPASALYRRLMEVGYQGGGQPVRLLGLGVRLDASLADANRLEQLSLFSEEPV